MNARQQTDPSDDTIATGTQYICLIDLADTSPGEIFGDPGVVRWRHTTRHPGTVAFFTRHFKAPDFVITDTDGNERMRIRRSGRLPSRFEMFEDGQVVGLITMRSVLRNSYTIDFKAGQSWTFRMPLFTIYFHGESKGGAKVWVRVGPPKRQWNILVEAGVDSVRLVYGLAFIHRQWWCYS